MERVDRMESTLLPSRDAQAQLRAILDAMTDGLLVVDDAGLVRYANSAAGAMLGRSGDSLVGQSFGLPVVAGEASEVDLIAEDGTARVAEMRVVAVEWDGHPAALAALRDITQRRQAEEARLALVREQAARAAAEDAVKNRDTFLSVAAHELKTPITSMTVAVQLLLRQTARPEGVAPTVLARHLGTINQQVRKLAEMVERVLDVSRVQMGRLILDREPTDVTRVVQSAAELVRPKAGARTLVVRHATDEPIVAEVDPLRLEQVVTNLLDNGIKYSPDGSTIEVDLSRARDTV
ncbi:MAG TPA: PAS domain S-box protein, partial [Chloroflexota bacterium]|nr:PAS domain S-box protein [Chloroflexota bacterium]